MSVDRRSSQLAERQRPVVVMMMLSRGIVGASLAALAVHAVPEQPEAIGTPDCADFDPRVPLVGDEAGAGLSTPSTHRGLQADCSAELSASAIAEFDALIAQHTVMYVQRLRSV